MGNVYKLRPDQISTDTVKALAQLHTLAKRGRVRGVGFVAYVDENEFIHNTAGEAHIDAYNTIGMLFSLVIQLAARPKGDYPNPP